MAEMFTPKEIEMRKTLEEVLAAVWESELVDKVTREHRRSGGVAITQLYQGYGLGAADFIALPIKAAIVGATRDTKRSFVTILLDREKEESLHAANVDAPDLGIEVTDISMDDQLFGQHHHVGFELHVTPDSLLSGNIEPAQRLRLAEIRRDRNARYWSDGKNSFRNFFQRNYIMYGIEGGRKAVERFDEKLRVRSKREEQPKQWRKEFLRQRKNLSLPAFSEFRQYLEETEGALLLPQVEEDDFPLHGEIYTHHE